MTIFHNVSIGRVAEQPVNLGTTSNEIKCQTINKFVKK